MDGRLRVLVLIAGIVLMHAPDVGAAFPKPIHTNKSRFRIPFKFDSAALERMETREVQLHVSRDHGATWELAQTLTPDGGKFEYQSLAEGEFWFSVKTLDGRNQLHPPQGAYETGLIVVVDNTPPVLELSLKQTVPGKVQLSWQATDKSLDAGTLRLEYLAPDEQEWEAISVVPHNSGETSWAVNRAGVVAVRGTIFDVAGNIGEAKAQLNTGGAGERGAKQRPNLKGPIAEMTPDERTSALNNEAPPVPFPVLPAAEDYGNQGPIITPQGSLRRYHSINGTAGSTTRSDASPDRWSPTSTPPSSAQSPSTVAQSARGPNASPKFVSQQTPGLEPVQRRPVPRQRIVTTRHFQIGYKIEEVGPSGVGGVELFITEDNGRKWWKYGDDADQKSPFDVEVPHDGVYGFAVRVSNGAGAASDPPLPGELPSIVVGVDQTVPVVELLPIQQGKGHNNDRLLIRWKVTEDHPSEKPISLYYAGNLNGPWEPVSGWKEDLNGSFEWVVGPAVPAQFYVRVMARDVAGNVGKAETPLPIIVDLAQPRAQIVDVEAPTAPQ